MPVSGRIATLLNAETCTSNNGTVMLLKGDRIRLVDPPEDICVYPGWVLASLESSCSDDNCFYVKDTSISIPIAQERIKNDCGLLIDDLSVSCTSFLPSVAVSDLSNDANSEQVPVSAFKHLFNSQDSGVDHDQGSQRSRSNTPEWTEPASTESIDSEGSKLAASSIGSSLLETDIDHQVMGDVSPRFNDSSRNLERQLRCVSSFIGPDSKSFPDSFLTGKPERSGTLQTSLLQHPNNQIQPKFCSNSGVQLISLPTVMGSSLKRQSFQPRPIPATRRLNKTENTIGNTPIENAVHSDFVSLNNDIHSAHNENAIPEPPDVNELNPTAACQSALEPASVEIRDKRKNTATSHNRTEAPNYPMWKWKKEISDDGLVTLINLFNHEKWYQARDESSGNIYYYNDNRSSVWSLEHVHSPLPVSSEQPQFIDTALKPMESDSFFHSTTDSKKFQISEPKSLNSTLLTTHDVSINRTKFSFNEKRLKKKWIECFPVLTGPTLYFFRDHRHTKLIPSLKNAELVLQTEYIFVEPVELPSDLTKRKHVLKITYNHPDQGSTGYLLEMNNANLLNTWLKAIGLCKDWTLNKIYSENPTLFERNKNQQKGNLGTEEKGSVVGILKNFFQNRPTKQDLEAKGILKNEQIFGSTLNLICEFENTEVPNFVSRCIAAIEKRGLDLVGIYRVNGNGAKIQTLRFRVDQNNYDLDSKEWEFEVLTGALKLFFRELKEPLIPFKSYDPLIDAIVKSKFDPVKKLSLVREIVYNMPVFNQATMRLLFHHLSKVLAMASVNQMQRFNLAMCFGPNLIYPEKEIEMDNLAMCLTQANHVIEFLIQETASLWPV